MSATPSLAPSSITPPPAAANVTESARNTFPTVGVLPPGAHCLELSSRNAAANRPRYAFVEERLISGEKAQDPCSHILF